MDSTFLTCPICYEEFNLTNHLARIIPTCGHSICTSCLVALIQNPTQVSKRCPLDKHLFSPELSHIEAFKVNFAINQIIEMHSQKQLCPDHNEEMNIVCLTDQCDICSTCAIEGRHKDHKLKTMKTLKSEMNCYLKKIEEIQKNIYICDLEAQNTSKEMKTSLLKKVKDEFGRMRRFLRDKEDDLVFQIHSCFYQEDSNIEGLIGKTSDIKKSFAAQFSDLDSALKRERVIHDQQFFQHVQENIAKYKPQLDFQALEDERNLIKSEFDKKIQDVKEFIDSQVKTWSELNFPLEKNTLGGLSRGILKELPGTNDNNTMETEQSLPLFNIETCLDFKHNQDELVISNKNMAEMIEIDLEKLKTASNVTLKFVNPVSKEDVRIFRFIWRKLQGTRVLHLESTLNGLSSNILQILAKNPAPFSKIKILLEKTDLRNEWATIVSYGAMLSNHPNLREIDLRFDGSTLKTGALQALLGNKLSSTANIEEFSLHLNDTNVTDDDLCELPLVLPNCKHFIIALRFTEIGSRTIQWLAKSCVPSMKGLETFKIYLNSTQVLDEDIEILLSEVKVTKKFTLDLGETSITDRSLRPLKQIVNNACNTLEEVQLGLFNTNVTDDALSQICIALPKIAKFTLDLTYTKITDFSVKKLAENTLASATDLKCLRVSFKGTRVSDHGMQAMFMNMKDLEDLLLDFGLTEVSDNSVGPFFVDKVRNMKELKIFAIIVSDSRVSSDLKNKIEEFQNTFKKN